MALSGLLGVHDTLPLSLCTFNYCLHDMYILNMSGNSGYDCEISDAEMPMSRSSAR